MSAADGVTAAEDYRERRYTSMDGLSLYYREYGPAHSDKTPVLCLPGLTRNSRDFHRVALDLARERRILCPDCRGRAKSDYDSRWWNYHLRTHTEDIRHLLIVANIHDVVVIGTSMGGILGMALAVAMPAAIKAIVINDVGPEIAGPGFESVRHYIKSERPLPDWSAAVEAMRSAFPDLPARSEADWLEIARGTYREDKSGKLIHDWDPKIITALERFKPERFNLWPLYRALGERPVLAVRGARSAILGEDVFERMGCELPNVSRLTVPDVGHAPALTEPAAREAIHDLLART